MKSMRRFLSLRCGLRWRACKRLPRRRPGPADIMKEWATVKLPSPPELKPVTLEGKTTALLILDVMKESCARRQRLQRDAFQTSRSCMTRRGGAGAMLFYTLVAAAVPTGADVAAGLTPKDGEWVIQRGPDKFLGSPLEQRLKERGITTVVVTGHLGAGRGNWSRLGRGPARLQGLSCRSMVYRPTIAFMELYAAYHLAKGGPVIVTEKVTLTRTDMIKF